MRFHVDELDLGSIGLFTVVTDKDLEMRGDDERSRSVREKDGRTGM